MGEVSFAATLTQNEFKGTAQEAADLFFKKMTTRMSELSSNFIVEQSDQQVIYFSIYDACSSHPKSSLDTNTEVFRVQMVQKKYSDRTYEEILHFSCRGKEFLFKEVLITKGEDLKTMSREEILKMNRRILLSGSELWREYTLYGNGDSSLPVFQITSDRKKNKITFSSNNTIFFSDERFQKNQVTYQKLILQSPITVQFGGSTMQYSSNDLELTVEEQANRNPWYFSSDNRLPLLQFQNVLKANLFDPINVTIGGVAQKILTSFPKTESEKPSGVSLFQIEFLKNLTKVQSGDFTTVKEFLERMNRGLNNGKLVVQDNGF